MENRKIIRKNNSKKVKNLGGVMNQKIQQTIKRPIHVTNQFCSDIKLIYGNFISTDLEYPAMGVTIEGTAIFVECKKYPRNAIIRRSTTDEVRGDHPLVKKLWNETLVHYKGKCRYSSVHIHPMDFPNLSFVDIDNYENVRNDRNAPNSLPPGSPFPVILINLHKGKLKLIGFWVYEGNSYRTKIRILNDNNPYLQRAWDNANPLSFFSQEMKCFNTIKNSLSDDWKIIFGEKNNGLEKAILVKGPNNGKLKIEFNNKKFGGLDHPLINEDKVRISRYIQWEKLFSDMIRISNPDSKKRKPTSKSKSGGNKIVKGNKKTQLKNEAKQSIKENVQVKANDTERENINISAHKKVNAPANNGEKEKAQLENKDQISNGNIKKSPEEPISNDHKVDNTLSNNDIGNKINVTA